MPMSLAFWLAVAGGGVARADVTVTSPRADSVVVTIYRDDLALVTETRTVDLPPDAVTLVLAGVVETLLPPSAVIADTGRALAESNFDFDRLTPASLLASSVGKTVTLTRTDRATGRVTRTAATILSAGDGVVLRTADGAEALHCSGLPERVELDAVPDALAAQPRLSVKLAAGEAGRRTVELSYLAHGFSWSSDYVARLNQRSDALALTGWVTLTNDTGATFEQAEVQVVAGALNLLPAEEHGSRNTYAGEQSSAEVGAAEIRAAAEQRVALLTSCFAMSVPRGVPAPDVRLFRMAADSAALEQVLVTASRVAEREELGDYQLYRLPWRTDLGARQTKQVAFLSKAAVRVERLYSFRLPSFAAQPSESPLALLVRFDNTAHAGLGEPLPRGRVRVFEPYGDGGEVFAGEAEIADKPVGLPVELAIARALNVTLESKTELRDEGAKAGALRAAVSAEHRISNAKNATIEVEIRHAAGGAWQALRLRSSSSPMRKKYGDFAWRLKVPPQSEVTLRYELEALERR
jgi:hypothetical protein